MSRRNAGPRLKWREDNKVWEIIWYETGNKRRLSTGTGDRTEADRVFAAFLADCLRKPSADGPRRPEDRLISDALADYVLEHGDHVMHREILGFALKSLLPFWGDMVVRDIRENVCRGYVARKVQEGLSVATGRR